jgi:hypothetical protein
MAVGCYEMFRSYPMGCRCNERRQALTRTVQAVKAADTKAVTSELAFVAKTAVQDTRSAFAQSVAAAKARLSRR